MNTLALQIKLNGRWWRLVLQRGFCVCIYYFYQETRLVRVFLLFQTALSDSQSLETNGEKNERTTRKVIQSQLTIFY